MKRISIIATILLMVFFSACSSYAYTIKKKDIPQVDLKITERNVILKGPITFKMADKICQKLADLDAENNDPIYMFIDTPGGFVSAGYKIIDVMKLTKSPIIGIVTGWCMSMGIHILVECDKKYTFESAEYLIHDVGLNLYYVQVRVAYKYVLNAMILNEKMLKSLHKKLTISLKELTIYSSAEWYFDSKTAWDIGMIDKKIVKLNMDEIHLNNVFKKANDLNLLFDFLNEMEFYKEKVIYMNWGVYERI